MVHDIDIHFLNLEQFRNLKLLDEIPFKKCVFLHFFGNECIIISYFQEKKPLFIKEEEILQMGIALFFRFFFIW
jgi:hypothetical protein